MLRCCLVILLASVAFAKDDDVSDDVTKPIYKVGLAPVKPLTFIQPAAVWPANSLTVLLML